MKNKFGIELLRKNSSSIGIAIIFLFINLGLFLLSILKNEKILGFVFLISISAIVLITLRIKTIVFYDKYIVQRTFWRKKIIWTCLYDEIQRVNINYFSDTFYRSKQVCFILKNGEIRQTILVHILVEKIAPPFLNRKIPVYIEVNGKYRLFETKKYKDIEDL